MVVGSRVQVEAIIARDLRYSDRFEMLDSLPASLVGEGIDYTLWDQLGATWLVSGQVEGLGEGFVLVLDLHNVVYAELREQARFPIPNPASEHFRMAVHRVSDQIVEWIFDEPGMAASRIAFSRVMGEGVQEIYLVDSDGENMRRLTNNGDISKSPAWHPSGEKLAYVRSVDLTPHRIFELDLRTGRERMLDPGREGQQSTPSYHPNGRELAFGLMGYNRTGLFSYDVERDCCLTHIQGGRWEDLSPTYSPDGRRIAFNSNRLGTNIPQVYVVSAQGGQADLVSPYVPGTHPVIIPHRTGLPPANRVAFHGRISTERPLPDPGGGGGGSEGNGAAAHGGGEQRGPELGPRRPPPGVFRGAELRLRPLRGGCRNGPDPAPGFQHSAQCSGMVSFPGRTGGGNVARGGVLRYMPWCEIGPDQAGELLRFRGVMPLRVFLCSYPFSDWELG